MRPIIDAHLDLSWCALSWDRDLTLTLDQLNQREQGMTDSTSRGRATVTFDELRRAGVAVCLGTVLARALPADGQDPTPVTELAGSTQQRRIPAEGSRRRDLDHPTQHHAHAVAQGQLAYYRQLERDGYLRLIHTRRDLDAHWRQWCEAESIESAPPPGVIVSMEGADPIVTPEQTAMWHEQGLRAIEPVHYGRSAYAVGTGFDGPLTEAGRALLGEMQRLDMILDVTHLSDQSLAEALERFDGHVIASHHNCRALVNHPRQLTDEQIHGLIERDGVIGAALDSFMLYPGFKIGQTPGDVVSLEAVTDHIDHVCQLAGSTRHSAIGSDLDGGFGSEQAPAGLERYTDLRKLEDILAERGYTDDDLDAIFHGNWLRVLRAALPQ